MLFTIRVTLGDNVIHDVTLNFEHREEGAWSAVARALDDFAEQRTAIEDKVSGLLDQDGVAVQAPPAPPWRRVPRTFGHPLKQHHVTEFFGYFARPSDNVSGVTDAVTGVFLGCYDASTNKNYPGPRGRLTPEGRLCVRNLRYTQVTDKHVAALKGEAGFLHENYDAVRDADTDEFLGVQHRKTGRFYAAR